MPGAASSTATTRDWRARRDDDEVRPDGGLREALPRSAHGATRDLARRGLPREKVLAAVVRLLELTLIRVGNDEYARLNHSFGLTTMRDRHARVDGHGDPLPVPGQVRQAPRRRPAGPAPRAAIVRRCQDLPGQDLFQYVDADGDVHDVTSDDVNGYLRDITGDDFTAKDFRTWAGTVARVPRPPAPYARPTAPPTRAMRSPPRCGPPPIASGTPRRSREAATSTLR